MLKYTGSILSCLGVNNINLEQYWLMLTRIYIEILEHNSVWINYITVNWCCHLTIKTIPKFRKENLECLHLNENQTSTAHTISNTNVSNNFQLMSISNQRELWYKNSTVLDSLNHIRDNRKYISITLSLLKQYAWWNHIFLLWWKTQHVTHCTPQEMQNIQIQALLHIIYIC